MAVLVKRVLGAATLAAVCAGPLASETLTDTLVSAYNNSNLLEQNRAVLRAADEDVATAVSALRPTLDYSMSRTYDYDFDDERSDADDTIGLISELSIFEGGRNRLAIEAAKEAVLAARQSLLSQEQDVLFSAVSAYFEVLRALEFVDLRQNNVRVLQEEVRASQDRFEVGEVTRTDVAQAESRLALAEANLVSAQGDLETAREEFRMAVGRYPNDLQPAPPDPQIPSTEAEARDMAARGHPQILEAQRLVTVAEINAARAEAALLPSLTGRADVGYSDAPNTSSQGNLDPSATLRLELSGPIYRGGSINSAFRSAVAQRDQNRANLLQTTLVITEQVGVAWSDLRVARASLQATIRQIDAAQIAFEGVREEATLGARTTLDVLNAEQELLNAQGDRIDALTQEQIALYGLLSATGRLTIDFLNLPVVAYDPSVYYNAVRGAPAVAPLSSAPGARLDRVLRGIGRY